MLIKKPEDLSKEQLLSELEKVNNLLPYTISTNEDFDTVFLFLWSNKLDNDFNENPYQVRITIDPFKEEEGEESVIKKECTCKGFVFKKGQVDCKHITQSIKIIKMNYGN